MPYDIGKVTGLVMNRHYIDLKHTAARQHFAPPPRFTDSVMSERPALREMGLPPGVGMNVLFLTNNPNLGSTTRILQSWLLLGQLNQLVGHVVVQRAGPFSNWLKAHGVHHLIDTMPWPNRRWPFPSLWHAWKVARWARRAGVQIIHCNEHDVYPFALLVRWLLRLPIVCHVRFRIGRPFCEWTFSKGRCPDALLWTSCQQREDCATAVEGIVPPASQHLVPLGLDLASFGTLASGRDDTRQSWGFRPDEVVLGTASAIRPHKRIEDFVELVAQMAREDARVVGVLAGDAMPGDEAYRDKILRQIENTGLGRRFRWVGNLEQVEPFYHALDVFVSTSEYETFGNSVCEAMACSRPVVAYRGGSVAEVLGDGGAIVENKDLSGLVSRVRECVLQPTRRHDLGQRGRQRVANCFDPAATLVKLTNLYTVLLSSRRGMIAS
jgi:L-malate glycosyltransferase